MARVRVECFSISLDGFGAGVEQSLQEPMGRGGEGLHGWAFKTVVFQKMFGNEGGATGIDNDFALRGFDNIGSWVLGRNMFGPIRGTWGDESWKGWWGDNPPYHCEVYVLTHYPRASLKMEGGTTFHFVTEGHRVALERALKSAGGRDVRIGGGVSTLHQYLRDRLIDELHIAISPVLLGAGENLFSGVNFAALGYQVVQHVPSENATHIVLRRS